MRRLPPPLRKAVVVVGATYWDHLRLLLVPKLYRRKFLCQGDATTVAKLAALPGAHHGAPELAWRTHLIRKPRAHLARGLKLHETGRLARVMRRRIDRMPTLL